MYRIPEPKDKFVFTEDFVIDGYETYFAGTKFKIHYIKKDEVTFYSIGTMEESEKMMQNIALRFVSSYKDDLAEIEKTIKVWEKEPEKFIIDPDNHMNKFHIECNEPPDVYKHIDGKTNYYSYQEGHNEWFDLKFYIEQRNITLKDISKFTHPNKTTMKELFSMSKQGTCVKIKEFNTSKYELI
jgi:hypothetical protein